MSWDRLGLGLSALCLVHCLALPVTLVSLAAGTAWVAHEQVHLWMAILVVPVAGLALWKGWRAHSDRLVAGLLVGGAALIVAALLVEPLVGHGGTTALTVLGGVLLAVGHLRNAQCARALRA